MGEKYTYAALCSIDDILIIIEVGLGCAREEVTILGRCMHPEVMYAPGCGKDKPGGEGGMGNDFIMI